MTSPRPTLPFDVSKLALDPGDTKTLGSINQHLLCILQALGIGHDRLSELLPKDTKAQLSEDRNSKLINEYAIKLDLSVEERIKNGSKLAIDTLLGALANPKTAVKDKLLVARDLLDRELGKAAQKIEVSGEIFQDTDFETMKVNMLATDMRLKALSEKQDLVKRALEARKEAPDLSKLLTIKAEVIDV